VTKIVLRTCPREGIMQSLYHEETKKKGVARRPAPAANIQHSAMTGKAEKVYMMKREKRKVCIQKKY
jgi:hypothetical protein